MGFENLICYRDQFPAAQNLIYLNHAAVAPLSRRCAEAMKGLADDTLNYGSFHYDQWLEAYAGLRRAAARLINAAPEEIALMKNTSEGISTIANGLDWHAGDTVVAFKEEFPSNQYPWQRLESKGVKIKWLSCADPLDKIHEAAQGARLLAISFVQYISGYRASLTQIGNICSDTGAIFFVDAIQGLGAFPLDVRESKIDALAADGHKWMCGPEGNAILYVSRRLQDRVDPFEFGWTNVANYNNYGVADMKLREDAGRYECGTLNTIGCYGLGAAIEFLLEIGIENIAPKVQALGDYVDCAARKKGFEVMIERTRETGAGIVSFKKPGAESADVVEHLKKHQVIAAARAGWVRFAPHFYLDFDQIDRAMELV
jgi:cysteine desulfurase / selenocysteine lyase